MADSSLAWDDLWEWLCAGFEVREKIQQHRVSTEGGKVAGRCNGSSGVPSGHGCAESGPVGCQEKWSPSPGRCRRWSAYAGSRPKTVWAWCGLVEEV